MPGNKSIAWTGENELTMLHALLFYGKVKIDNNVAADVAAILGGIPVSSVKRQVWEIKNKFGKKLANGSLMVPTTASDVITAPVATRKRGAAVKLLKDSPKRSKFSAKKQDVTGDETIEEDINDGDSEVKIKNENDDSMDISMELETPSSSPETLSTGKIVSLSARRSSSRPIVSTGGYSANANRFPDLSADEQLNVSSPTEDLDSEDSDGSDGTFYFVPFKKAKTTENM